MQPRRNERREDITIFRMSTSLTKWVLVGLTLFSIGSLYFNFTLFENVENLTYQLTEEGITTIIHERDEISTSYIDLKIQYEQLKEDYETLEEKNKEILQQLQVAELEYITVTGIIIKKIGQDWIGEVTRTPLEIKFESSSGELMARDNDLDNGRYSVTLDNNCIYIVKIRYSSNLFSSWITVDSNFRLDSDVSVFSKNW